MPYATLLYHTRWRKKKANYIIPPTYYKTQGYSITKNVATVQVSSSKIQVEDQVAKTEATVEGVPAETTSLQFEEIAVEKIKSKITDNYTATKVSAFSIKSIALKKELAESHKNSARAATAYLTEAFTETDMLEHWMKYVQRLNDKGHMIMMSLLNINKPTLDGTTIIHELPNEGSKIDFEREMPELLGYLRGKLHNHDIKIEVNVNEELVNKKAFTVQDKYNRMNEINPNLELLRRTFDLDL